MAEAYIYDAVRTPRGRGKSTGSLHEITALQLATQTLKAIKERNNLPDTSRIDDVILGCVTPIGEQGSVIAKVADFTPTFGYQMAQLNFSPITGPEGNIEYLAQLLPGEDGRQGVTQDRIAQVVREAHETLNKHACEA